jgi:hypothetical protein
MWCEIGALLNGAILLMVGEGIGGSHGKQVDHLGADLRLPGSIAPVPAANS